MAVSIIVIPEIKSLVSAVDGGIGFLNKMIGGQPEKLNLKYLVKYVNIDKKCLQFQLWNNIYK